MALWNSWRRLKRAWHLTNRRPSSSYLLQGIPNVPIWAAPDGTVHCVCAYWGVSWTGKRGQLLLGVRKGSPDLVWKLRPMWSAKSLLAPLLPFGIIKNPAIRQEPKPTSHLGSFQQQSRDFLRPQCCFSTKSTRACVCMEMSYLGDRGRKMRKIERSVPLWAQQLVDMITMQKHPQLPSECAIVVAGRLKVEFTSSCWGSFTRQLLPLLLRGDFYG